jgi:hypothetical protein
MPINEGGVAAHHQNPLVAPVGWQNEIPRIENRSESISSPKGRLTWCLYLTGAEGYVGRDGLNSGGIYGLDGQPYIQTPDIVYETHDRIHWHELRDIHDHFMKEKIPETVRICERDLKVENKVDDLYFQGRFYETNEEGEEVESETVTVFHTYRSIMVGFGKAGSNMREQYVGMRRVADFFLVNTF